MAEKAVDSDHWHQMHGHVSFGQADRRKAKTKATSGNGV